MAGPLLRMAQVLRKAAHLCCNQSLVDGQLDEDIGRNACEKPAILCSLSPSESGSEAK